MPGANAWTPRWRRRLALCVCLGCHTIREPSRRSTAMRAWICIVGCLLVFTPMIASGSESRPKDVSALVSGNNAFALSLYAQLEAGDDNVFFSPTSISAALAMTYAGARGQTAE